MLWKKMQSNNKIHICIPLDALRGNRIGYRGSHYLFTVWTRGIFFPWQKVEERVR